MTQIYSQMLSENVEKLETENIFISTEKSMQIYNTSESFVSYQGNFQYIGLGHTVLVVIVVSSTPPTALVW